VAQLKPVMAADKSVPVSSLHSLPTIIVRARSGKRCYNFDAFSAGAVTQISSPLKPGDAHASTSIDGNQFAVADRR
jgi:hypothetical protein